MLDLHVQVVHVGVKRLQLAQLQEVGGKQSEGLWGRVDGCEITGQSTRTEQVSRPEQEVEGWFSSLLKSSDEVVDLFIF